MLAISFNIFVKERETDYHYFQLQIVSTDLDPFFPCKGVSPTEYLSKEAVRELVDEYLEILLTKKVWVEAGIKKIQGADRMQVVQT